MAVLDRRSFSEEDALKHLIAVVNSVLGSKLLDPVVSKAQTWGFICQRQPAKGWLILPRQADRRWKLEQVEDRWILSIDNVPQLRLHTEDAIAFLATRRHEQG